MKQCMTHPHKTFCFHESFFLSLADSVPEDDDFYQLQYVKKKATEELMIVGASVPFRIRPEKKKATRREGNRTMDTSTTNTIETATDVGNNSDQEEEEVDDEYMVIKTKTCLELEQYKVMRNDFLTQPFI